MVSHFIGVDYFDNPTRASARGNFPSALVSVSVRLFTLENIMTLISNSYLAPVRKYAGVCRWEIGKAFFKWVVRRI